MKWNPLNIVTQRAIVAPILSFTKEGLISYTHDFFLETKKIAKVSKKISKTKSLTI